MNIQNLTFMVSLLDKVSGPAGAMMKTMDNVTTRIQSGYQKIGVGIAGVAGTGYALESAIAPTKEMQAALGSLKSLGVADDVLSNLTNTALKFSLKYGESATDFVKSSYNIQSAISGLSGNELAAFTNASSILAKGTMADMGTITDYVGTMYSVFKESADGMGKSNWIEQLAGQTALAVNIFKTTGQGMSEAFSGLSGASSAPLNEQLAVLGQLQAVKHGSEAGTLYKSFLNGVGNSQKDLGLNFTDMNGKLLPMVDILTKITGKFGSLENQATRDVITKALGGTDAMALVDILSKDITGLNNNIADIGKQTGMQNAIEMANAMTMPWDRAAQGINALSISFGMRLMPEINAFFDTINGGIQTMLRWNTLFPELSRWLGVAALGVFGLIAGVSLLSIVMGVATLASGGLAAIFAIISSPIILLAAGIAYAIYKWDEWGGR